MNIDPVIVLSVIIVALAGINTWIVIRPFERARREARRAQHNAE